MERRSHRFARVLTGATLLGALLAPIAASAADAVGDPGFKIVALTTIFALV